MKNIQEAFEFYLKISFDFINPSKKLIQELEAYLARRNSPENTLAIMLLGKNLHTFKKIREFLQKEEYEETFALLKLTLERIALTFRMLKDGLSCETAENLKVSSCFPDLKRQFEDLEKIYGFFLKVAHVDAYQHTIFYLLFKSRKGIDKFKNTKRKKLIILTNILFCVLAEINLAVIEFLAKDYLENVRTWKYIENRWWKYTPVNKKVIPGLESWDVSSTLKGYF